MKYAEVLSQDDILLLRGLPDVQSAYERLQKGSVSFEITLPDDIQQKLFERMGLSMKRVPCRWIRGDTPAHIDKGPTAFQNTYLVYLTDSPGELRVGGESYPIQAGTGFSFAEGTSHEVVETNGTDRLMLGPMSEQGLAVGGPTIVYIRQNGGVQQQSTDQINWSNISWPFGISGGFQIVFTTDLTLTSADNYFVCSGPNITIGSTTLNPDGTRPVITVTATNYPGLIQNGTEEGAGYNNISVYNLEVNGTGGTLVGDAGWIGARFYGKDAFNNFIIGCSSDGPIPQGGGGIVGVEAGSATVGSTADLTIVGCTSSGTIASRGGGIAGGYCGNNANSTVTIRNCSSSGTIGLFAGGIVGDSCGYNQATSSIENCYSTGAIGSPGGGIAGRFAGNNGTVTVTNCYSRGSIEANGGGIFGTVAAFNGGTTTATNCYSSGSLATAGNGIYGTGKGGGATNPNCYVADANWSDAGAAALQGVPLVHPGVGTTWVSVGLNQPYLLNNFGYTPYDLTNIDGSSKQLIQTFSQSVQAGNTSSAAVLPAGYTYAILDGGDPTITINGTTGAITTTSETAVLEYTLVVYATNNPYSITTFVLTVTEGPTPPTPTTTTEEQLPSSRGKGFDYHTLADIERGKRLILERLTNPNIRFKNYADYNKYRMAMFASLKPNL